MRLHTLLFSTAAIIFIWGIMPLLWIIASILLGLPQLDNPLLKLEGLLLVIIGAILELHCMLLFKHAGKGTVAVTEPPTKFVIKGAYRLTRNPLYIAHFITLMGQFLILGYLLMPLWPITFLLILQAYIVRREEPVLIGRFGEIYEHYLKQVPRWL